MPWSEEEDRVLKAGVEETTGENGTKDWEAVHAPAAGRLLPHGKQARHRYARILNGQKKPGRNKCNICGQPKKGHSCSGSPTIVATGLSAAQIRKGRAPAARRTANVKEAQSPIVAEFAAMLDAAAFSAEPTLGRRARARAPGVAAHHADGRRRERGGPARWRAVHRTLVVAVVRLPSGSPPGPRPRQELLVLLDARAGDGERLDARRVALFDALATDAKVAPPDEPTPLDLDHVKRAKFSPPHEPADTSFDGVPSLVDGNFLPAWI